MDYGEKARALHDDKPLRLNCAQGVLCALEDKTGLDHETGKRISSGFGGGLRRGEICGAITGAAMAVGLAAGDGDGHKEGMIAPVMQRLVDEFRTEYGCVRCEELKEKFGGQGHCGDFIAYCGRLAAALIEEQENNKK